MEQLQNGMLTMLQNMVNQLAPGKPGGKGESAEESEFQKLLDQQNQASESNNRKEPTQAETPKKETPNAEQPQKEPVRQEAPVKPQKLEEAAEQERILMAAMQTVQQNPQVVDAAILVEEGTVPAGLAELPAAGENVLLSDSQPQNQAGDLLESMSSGAQAQAAPQEELVQAVENADTAAEAEVQLQQPTRQRTEGLEVEAAPEEAIGEEDAEVVSAYAASEPQALFQEVEAAPIKVSDAAVPEETSEAPDVGQQVDRGLAQALEQGESRVQIDLTPEYLGSVRVEITHTADGALHVALSAESSQTRSLLERHAEQLQSILSGQGREGTVQVEVQRQQESQQHQQQGQYDGHNGHPQQEQQQRRRQEHSENPQDFLHQLRLGLVPAEAE